MANEIKVFQGSYIYNIGLPFIVVTGYSTVTSELNSEYFTLIQGDKDYFENERITFDYGDIPPHQIEIDINLLMDTALSKAKFLLEKYIDRKYLEKQINQMIPMIELKELSEKALYQLYLLNEQSTQLNLIKDRSDSPYLKVLMQKIYTLPRFK